MHIRFLSLMIAVCLALSLGAPGGIAAGAANPLPDDVQLVTKFDLPRYGLTYERYQQTFGAAEVLGGQLTALRAADGRIQALIGAHFPALQPANTVRLSHEQARGVAVRELGAAGERLSTLMIDPADGRYFYRVETRRPDSRWVLDLDAGSGAVRQKFNALTTDCDGQGSPCGFGVAYDNGDPTDVKDLSGLTTWNGSAYLLQSADGRQETHDQGSTRRPFLGPIATDADDSWVTPGDISPAQPALVDAQYYANLTDEYYLTSFGYDWVAAGIADPDHNLSAMVVHAHYTYYYVNAFWNGSYVAIGDGDQEEYRELTALDVVVHEFTHGVTDFTSNLIYQDESGALNEAFSDIMAASAEFWAEATGREPATSLAPDWLVAEDIDLRGLPNPGFRNMADPEEDGDPDHYSERYIGSDDNGGVHSNSGIGNHAYYLLVEGGLNASCASPLDHNSAHCTGTETPVAGIGLADAQDIFFVGFTALAEDATMCDARSATLTAAETLFGAGSGQAASTGAAWAAVGLDEALCGGGGENLPPTAAFSFTTNGLTANFSDASTDPDGTVVAWSWNFGDGSTSTQQNPSHTYTAGGTYNVTLTVTDDDGAVGNTAQPVTVTAPSGEISLSVSGYKSRGVAYANLSWSGATSANVDVYRNGAILTTTPNDGAYTDTLGKVWGTFTYQVCEAGTSTCSNTASVTY